MANIDTNINFKLITSTLAIVYMYYNNIIRFIIIVNYIIYIYIVLYYIQYITQLG